MNQTQVRYFENLNFGLIASSDESEPSLVFLTLNFGHFEGLIASSDESDQSPVL